MSIAVKWTLIYQIKKLFRIKWKNCNFFISQVWRAVEAKQYHQPIKVIITLDSIFEKSIQISSIKNIELLSSHQWKKKNVDIAGRSKRDQNRGQKWSLHMAAVNFRWALLEIIKRLKTKFFWPFLLTTVWKRFISLLILWSK